MSKQEDVLLYYDYSSILRPTVMLLDELEPVVSGKGSPISCHIYCKSFAINIQSGSDDRLTLHPHSPTRHNLGAHRTFNLVVQLNNLVKNLDMI